MSVWLTLCSGVLRKKRAATVEAGLPDSMFNAILFTCSRVLPPSHHNPASPGQGHIFLHAVWGTRVQTLGRRIRGSGELEWVSGWDNVLVKEISVTYDERQRRHLSSTQP